MHVTLHAFLALQECIKAAEQAERAQAQGLAVRLASAGSGAAPAIAEEDTDSDGGMLVI